MKLTQRTTATGVTLNDTFIHVVNTGDTSQDPTGSSYKVPLSLLSPLFTGSTGVSGSGTNNYVARWTPDGFTLAESQIKDDGTNLAIGGAVLDSSVKMNMTADVGNVFGINMAMTKNSAIGVSGVSPVAGTGTNTGVRGIGQGSSGFNFGIYGQAVGTSGSSVAIGLKSFAGSGSLNYSAELKDGTEVAGRFLKCMDGNGRANWANITSADTTGASGSFTSADGKTITVTNGLITSIV